MLSVFFFAIGCALGGICRYLGTMMTVKLCGNTFPWGTLTVNSLGSFLLGIVLSRELPDLSAPPFYTVSTIGFCSGLTTFSAFSLESLWLISERKWATAGFNILGSVLLCSLWIISGYAIGEKVMT